MVKPIYEKLTDAEVAKLGLSPGVYYRKADGTIVDASGWVVELSNG